MRISGIVLSLAALAAAAALDEGKPIADNNASDGRAKNRRVELVKM